MIDDKLRTARDVASECVYAALSVQQALNNTDGTVCEIVSAIERASAAVDRWRRTPTDIVELLTSVSAETRASPVTLRLWRSVTGHQLAAMVAGAYAKLDDMNVEVAQDATRTEAEAAIIKYVKGAAAVIAISNADATDVVEEINRESEWAIERTRRTRDTHNTCTSL